MSHVTGSVQPVSPSVKLGPDSGTPPSAPNTWTHSFAHELAPGGTKFLILHFQNVNLPASNRLEVDLGYDTDTFTAVDGNEFWTRPVNVNALAGGLVPIRYITNGAANGSVELDKYGRGERHAGEQDPTSLSNCDPFFTGAAYLEPKYDPFWFCGAGQAWENAACLPTGDVRSKVASSVGMILMIGKAEKTEDQIISSCSVTLIGPDLVLCAGHCFDKFELNETAASSSVIFNYQTNCDGTRPSGYSPRFHKVKKIIKWRYPQDSPPDYCQLELKSAPGLPAIPVRTDLPALGEQVFGIHHPNGAVKKLSIPHPGYATLASSSADTLVCNLDVSGGSSVRDSLMQQAGLLGFSLTGRNVPSSTIPLPPCCRTSMQQRCRSPEM